MKKTKTIKQNYMRWSILALLLIFVLMARWNEGIGEFYAVHLYPFISVVLSGIASVVPFSLTETVVIAVSLWLLLFPFYASKRMQQNWKYIMRCEVEMLIWVYVWFYIGWGMNYYRDDFHQRMDIPAVRYDEDKFKAFIVAYADSLNASYTTEAGLTKREVEDEVKRIYAGLPSGWGLAEPHSFQHPKISLVNTLYSKVGVLGFMGPFFSESHVNHELLPMQYPFTYAHELSHLLGISSEAEANFWAFQICTHSANLYIKYSGYFGLLPHVVNNAYAVLPKEEFQLWLKQINPQIMIEYKKQSAYWESLYSPAIGALQNAIYDFYLKGNRIASGTKNYGQVVGLILSLPQDWSLTEK